MEGKKTEPQIFSLNFSQVMFYSVIQMYIFPTFPPNKNYAFVASFLLASFIVRTVQDCLLYLPTRIYFVSAN
jgi:hypothetical protein